jgi:monooxygenase
MEHFDVIIVGAGLSGIGAGYHLQSRCPNHSYVILEGRATIGGTWDIFQYPGIRCDSDMYTLGFSFRPWTNPKAISDGPSILEYTKDAAREYGIDKRIRCQHKVVGASWSTKEARWTVEVACGENKEIRHFTCNFLSANAGFYNHESGYKPEFAGSEHFKGPIVHPQDWTPDIDYAGKRVVIIGSGATAVTMIPSMTDTAEHVTMLQRSPGFIISMPAEDKLANLMRKILPSRVAYSITRWKNVLKATLIYGVSLRYPNKIRAMLLNKMKEGLGPDADMEKDYNPQYQPWDQRLCLSPDGDFFDVIREKKASVVTDEIERFTEKGILLKSGRELEADLIVTATGLILTVAGSIPLTVDGETIDIAKTMNYKGFLLSDVPNFSMSVGYTANSWTLKTDLIAEYISRVLRHMEKHGKKIVVAPRTKDPSIEEQRLNVLTSGYVERGVHLLPKQGSKSPWKLYQNYFQDIYTIRFKRIDDGVLQFSNPPEPVALPAKKAKLAAVS